MWDFNDPETVMKCCICMRAEGLLKRVKDLCELSAAELVSVVMKLNVESTTIDDGRADPGSVSKLACLIVWRRP